MGIKRIVDTSFWTDPSTEEFTPEDKYFMLYILTNPFTTQLGIYGLSIKNAAFQLGYSKEAVEHLLDRFENTYGIIFYSKSTKEIAVKNFLRHSIVKGGAPVRDCLISEMKKVKNKDLIAKVFAHIKNDDNLNITVKYIIEEYEEKNGSLSYSNEKENKNENENDVSYHDSYDDSFTQDIPNKTKKKKESAPYVADNDLNAAIVAFIEYRKKIKKPMTDRAITLLINELNKLSSDIVTQIAIINQSILNGWQGVFPLKDNRQTQTGRRENVPQWLRDKERESNVGYMEAVEKAILQSDFDKMKAQAEERIKEVCGKEE